jgi:DNA-binding transcriptional LysR family regulator
MDLNKVREFLELVRSMNFTAAARCLNLSQPALSKHVRDLEQELGVALINRGSLGTRSTLTPAGHLFADRMAELLAEYDGIAAECAALDAAMPPARIQDVRISFNVSLQLRSYLERAGCSGGNYAYVPTSLPTFDALDQDEVDFALWVETAPTVTPLANDPKMAERYGSVPLCPEQLVLLASATNPAARNSEWVSLSELGRHRVVTMEMSRHTNWREACLDLFARHGCAISYRVVRDSPLQGGAFPIGEHDFVLCTQRFARGYAELDVEDVRVLTVEEFEPVIYPFLLYRRDTEAPMARLIANAVEQAERGETCM